MSDASVSCKVGARNWTLVVFANLFYTVYLDMCRYLAESVIPGANQGVFLRRDLKEGSLATLYNGVVWNFIVN